MAWRAAGLGQPAHAAQARAVLTPGVANAFSLVGIAPLVSRFADPLAEMRR